MNSACASQIRPRSDSPSLRNAPTDRQTDRHLSFIYIDLKFGRHVQVPFSLFCFAVELGVVYNQVVEYSSHLTVEGFQ